MIGNNISSIRPIRATFTSNKITPKARTQSFGAKIPSAQQATTKGKSFFSSIVKLLKINDLIKSFKASPIDKLKKESKAALNITEQPIKYSQRRVRKKKGLYTRKKKRRGNRGSGLVRPSLIISGPGKNGSKIELRMYEKTDLLPPEISLSRCISDNESSSLQELIEISPNKISHMKEKEGGNTLYTTREIPEGQQLEKWLNLAKKLILSSQKNKPN